MKAAAIACRERGHAVAPRAVRAVERGDKVGGEQPRDAGAA